MLNRSDGPTPCGVLFDVLKRRGGISHKELAQILLSERPLSDGRSPASRAFDRTWVSHYVVHAPVSTVQPAFFKDFGISAARILDRLHSGRRAWSAEAVLDFVRNDVSPALELSLEGCRQNTGLYRNALTRLSTGAGYSAGERAEAAMVLLVSTACLANVRQAVAYTMEYAQGIMGRRVSSPELFVAGSAPVCEEEPAGPIGLARIRGGRIAGAPRWIAPGMCPVEVGALACGPHDVTDVEADVSARHLLIDYGSDGEAPGGWLVQDLHSTNGSMLVDAESGEERVLEPGVPVPLRPGDELVLGAATRFVVLEGAPGLV